LRRDGGTPKVNAAVRIENVVGSATLNQKIDLNEVFKVYPGVLGN